MDEIIRTASEIKFVIIFSSFKRSQNQWTDTNCNRNCGKAHHEQSDLGMKEKPLNS